MGNTFQLPAHQGNAGHNNYRSVLEVLKLSAPQDVLQSHSLVLNRGWTRASSSWELWRTFLDDFQIAYDPSTHPKTTFSFLRQQQTVVTLTPEVVGFLNKEKRSWDCVSLSESIDWHGAAYVLLLNGSVLCCGSRESPKRVWVISSTGQVSVRPDLITARFFHGTVEHKQRVFVFGGNSAKGNVLQNEMMDGNRRIALPNLHSKRFCFVPCVFRGLIYLSGGYNASVEVCDPRSLNLWVLTINDILGSSNPCVSAVYQDSLVIVTSASMFKWDFQRKTLIATRVLRWNITTPVRAVVDGDLLYVCNSKDPYCTVLSLKAG